MVPSETSGFPTWRTGRRGTYKTLEAYLAAMRQKKYAVGMWAKQLLPQVVWAQEEGGEELVRVLDHQLGLTGPYTLDELTAAAAAFDLHRLDADVAAGLCEQCDDQPLGEWVLYAMDPIPDSDLYPEVFWSGHGASGMFLQTEFAGPEDRFDLGRVWIFSRRRRAAQG